MHNIRPSNLTEMFQFLLEKSRVCRNHGTRLTPPPPSSSPRLWRPCVRGGGRVRLQKRRNGTRPTSGSGTPTRVSNGRYDGDNGRRLVGTAARGPTATVISAPRVRRSRRIHDGPDRRSRFSEFGANLPRCLGQRLSPVPNPDGAPHVPESTASNARSRISGKLATSLVVRSIGTHRRVTSAAARQMDDSELEALRAKRMAQMQTENGGRPVSGLETDRVVSGRDVRFPPGNTAAVYSSRGRGDLGEVPHGQRTVSNVTVR